MIQRIEHGWVQVNENHPKGNGAPVAGHRPQSQESENGRALKPPIFKATIDLMA